MRGLFVEGGRLAYRRDLSAIEPRRRGGDARVRVQLAGICSTDLALVRGNIGFSGVPGHEFVGVALDGPLAGERVVGEINAACGSCGRCRAGLARHCGARTVLGILGRPGAFAEELVRPAQSLHRAPAGLPSDRAVQVLALFQQKVEIAGRHPERAALVPAGVRWRSEALASGAVRVDGFVHGRFALEQGERAFARAAEKGVLEILVDLEGAA